MKLFAQILVVSLCAYLAAGSRLSNILSAAQNAADTVAQDAVNAADDAVSAGKSLASSIIDKIDNLLHHHSNQSNVPTIDTCYSNYNGQLDAINVNTVSQTQDCYAVAQNSSANVVQNVNSSYADALMLSQSIQAQLAVCDAGATEMDAFSCYVATFDANLKNLDQLAIESQLAVAYLDGYQTEVDITKSGCVSTVILASKANSTTALNTLESCLDSVSSTPSGLGASSSGSGGSPVASGDGSIQVQIF